MPHLHRPAQHRASAELLHLARCLPCLVIRPPLCHRTPKAGVVSIRTRTLVATTPSSSFASKPRQRTEHALLLPGVVGGGGYCACSQWPHQCSQSATLGSDNPERGRSCHAEMCDSRWLIIPQLSRRSSPRREHTSRQLCVGARTHGDPRPLHMTSTPSTATQSRTTRRPRSRA